MKKYPNKTVENTTDAGDDSRSLAAGTTYPPIKSHPLSGRSIRASITNLAETRYADWFQIFLLMVLLYGSVVYVYSYNLHGLSFRVEHLATGVLIIISPFVLLRSSRQELSELWPFAFFGVYILISVLSILINSKYYLSSFAEVGLQLITVCSAIFSYLIINNESRIRRFAVAIVVLGMIEAFLGIGGALFSTLVSGKNIMAQTTTSLFKIPAGTQNEANVFGSFMAPIALLAWSMFRSANERRKIIAWGAVAAVAFFSILLSYSRAAWIAAIAGIILVELGLRIRFHLKLSISQKKIMLASSAFIVLALVAYLSLPYKIHAGEGYIYPVPVDNIRDFGSKIFRSADPSDPSIQTRIELTGSAIEDWSDDPWLGPGARAFLDPDHDGEKPTHAFNYSLLALYNSGVIGFVFYICFLAFCLLRTFQGFRNANTPLYIAYGAGFVSLILVYNTSNAVLTAYPWLLFGIVLRTYQISKSASEETSNE